MKKFSIIILLTTIPLFVQSQEKKLIQFTGRLYSELLEPLPYAHILILNSLRGTITGEKGKFSFVVEENDSILFSTVGYRRRTIVIPDTLKEPFFTRDIILEQDTFMIDEVRIYPWKSYEEFKEAFINLKFPDDDMETARKNIALIKTQIIMDNTPDPGANFNYIMQEQYRQTFTQGQYPTYQLFNAFAWAKFFEALKKGDFKQKKQGGD